MLDNQPLFKLLSKTSVDFGATEFNERITSSFHALLITTISLKSMISEISREEKAQNEPNFTEIRKSEKCFPK